LLSFSESTVDYISLAKKGKRVATSKSRIEFSGMVDLGAVRVAELETRLNEKIRRFFTRVTRGMGGAIPDKTWSALIDAVKAIRPNLQADIERLLSLQAYSKFRLLGHAAEVLLRERDALGISLDIFSGSNRLRDQVLSQWAPRRNTVRDINETEGTASLGGLPAGSSSFLRGIPQRYLQEEATIQHDLFNWEGLTPKHEAGV